MVIVYAPSYASLVASLSFYPLEEIIVYTENSKIIDFCNTAKLKSYLLKTHTDLSIKGYREHKKYIQNEAKKVQNKEVFFGFNSYCLWGLYFIQLLGKNNTVFFNFSDNVYPRKNFCKSISKHYYTKTLWVKIVFWATTGMCLDIFLLSKEIYFLGMEKSRLEKRFHKKERKADEIFQTNVRAIKDVFHIPTFHFLLVDTECVDFSIDEKVIGELSQLFDELSDKVCIKPHPTFTPEKKLYPQLKEIDALLPIEFLIHPENTVIGVYSTALKHFCRFQKTISIIDLVNLGNYRL